MKPYLKYLLLLLFLTPLNLFAQNTQYAFRVYFTNKDNTNFSLNNPAAYLSTTAIDRRVKFNIPIDSTDLPIVHDYIDSVLQATNGELRVSSRWHNSMVVILSDSSLIQNLSQFSFYKSSKLVGVYNPSNPLKGTKQGQKPASVPGDEDYYGNAWQQINMCHGSYLHQKGYLGGGMKIAVIDAGFQGVESATAFDSLRNQNRIIDLWNFTKDTSDFANYDHGTKVLSCMAANLPDAFVGAAPNAEYALYTTDVYNTEQTIEEDYWTAAAERADSLGVDLISTSVGYNTFDQVENSYTYQDMDGKTTFIAQSCNAAVRKGIMVLASAGNEGHTAWHYILTPGDADSAFTIGSVNQLKTPAMSSSYGPNADSVRKPDVVGLGQGAAVVNQYGNLTTGNGTSFATPIIAGLTACFMQANPNLKPYEIKQIIRSVSDHYTNPDYKVGNGIPDFKAAYDLITAIKVPEETKQALTIFPNPFNTSFFIKLNNKQKPESIQLMNVFGQIIPLKIEKSNPELVEIKTDRLAEGIYYLKVQFKDSRSQTKMLHLAF